MKKLIRKNITTAQVKSEIMLRPEAKFHEKKKNLFLPHEEGHWKKQQVYEK